MRLSQGATSSARWCCESRKRFSRMDTLVFFSGEGTRTAAPDGESLCGLASRGG